MSEIKEYPEIGGKYHHYKGGKYEVITMATHTETNEALVIYKSLLFGSIYARPLTEWNETVDIGSSYVKRFKKIID
jgi:hypothetical protein